MYGIIGSNNSIRQRNASNRFLKIYSAINITKPDILLVAFFILFACVFNFALSSALNRNFQGYEVSIKTTGQSMNVPLALDGVYELEANTVEILNGRVRMLYADCPDQVCMRQGFISRSNETIVCLPNSVIISIAGANGGVDAVAR